MTRIGEVPEDEFWFRVTPSFAFNYKRELRYAPEALADFVGRPDFDIRVHAHSWDEARRKLTHWHPLGWEWPR